MPIAAAWKSAGCQLKLWWDSHKEYVGDILPQEAFTKCLLVKAEWSSGEAELCEVVQSSAVGKQAFGLAWKQLQSNNVNAFVSEGIADLLSVKIAPTCIEQVRTGVLKKVADTGRNPREMHQKREVEVEYRGCRVNVEVHSFFDAWLIHTAATIEGAAVDQGSLEALSYESELTPQNRPKTRLEFEDAA